MPCRGSSQWLSEPLAAFAFLTWGVGFLLVLLTSGKCPHSLLTEEGLEEKGEERVPQTWNAN